MNQCTFNINRLQIYARFFNFCVSKQTEGPSTTDGVWEVFSCSLMCIYGGQEASLNSEHSKLDDKDYYHRNMNSVIITMVVARLFCREDPQEGLVLHRRASSHLCPFSQGFDLTNSSLIQQTSYNEFVSSPAFDTVNKCKLLAVYILALNIYSFITMFVLIDPCLKPWPDCSAFLFEFFMTQGGKVYFSEF